MATGNQSRKSNAARRKSKATARIVIFAIEIIIILVMLVVVAKVFKTTEEEEGPHYVEIEETQIAINSEVEENETLKGYWNIALFGLDATDKKLDKGWRSDSMMVASINLDTGDIKLVSVYRDTYLNRGNDYYSKANGAYKNGGAEQAIGMLNMNLDLDIKDFVTVNYQGLIDCIDGLGGIYLDIDSAELKHINNYQITIANDVLDGNYNPVKETGYQKVDGLQAAAYCRIRYTAGDDFKRAERQREVIQAIQDKAKESDAATLVKVFTKVINNVYTSISQEDILAMLKEVANYSIVDEGGFPHQDLRTVGDIGTKGSCVIPVDLEKNVQWLHEFLFDDTQYTVSADVKEYSERIKEETTPYIQR